MRGGCLSFLQMEKVKVGEPGGLAGKVVTSMSQGEQQEICPEGEGGARSCSRKKRGGERYRTRTMKKGISGLNLKKGKKRGLRD